MVGGVAIVENRKGNTLRHWLRWPASSRGVIVAMVLLSQLAANCGVGFSPARSIESASYPCQLRGCGCGTAEECWRGDCCCFTLEEKLAWANANGIEPPGHVRTMVAARKGRPAGGRRESCCECEASASKSESSCCDPKSAPARSVWMFGLAMQKCRGVGTMNVQFLPPAVVPAAILELLIDRPCAGDMGGFDERAKTPPHFPPTPPPRS